MIYRDVAKVDDPPAMMNRLDFTFRGVLRESERLTMTDDEFAQLLRSSGRKTATALQTRRNQTLRLTFDVDRVWKGQVGTPFVTLIAEHAPCTVAPVLSFGKTYIVFGNRHRDDQPVIHHLIGASIQDVARRLTRGY